MEFINKCFINGKWENAVSGKTFSVYNPASGEILGYVPFCSTIDAQLAIKSAGDAFLPWKKTTGKERSKILRKFYELIIANKEQLAKIMVMEQGKVISEARAEIEYGASFIEWFSEEAKRIYGDIVPKLKAEQKLFTFKEPIGVIAAITPWNFPSAMITRKIAPALAAGCTVIVKPSEETPYSALFLAKLAQEAGLPDGVLNIIFGDANAIGDALTLSPEVRMLTFTGSTSVGKLLMGKCSKTVKKVTLELGGNAPFIVFEDANIEEAVKGLLASKLRNGGQSCICVNRVYIHINIFEEFLKRLKAEFSSIKVGNGLDETNNIGALINEKAVNKVNMLVSDALQNGGEILYQAKIHRPSPCFLAPLIISNNSDNTLIAKEEIFAPIISLFKFENEDEVIERANATNYGLAAYIYTEDMRRAWRVSEELEYGMVAINDVGISSEVASFGGVKESGIGREGGRSGILEYLEDKFIVMR
ncbi:NAD-dependent succinate-semialdehyde dehydrogenase [Holosporaceae bacterium 'Namur']|nr:NAD-dependent succinate-semialdehyde dehydrogenase [Holosporaceae bacterium 'Namur']